MLADTITLDLLKNTGVWQQQGHVHLHEGFFMLRNLKFPSREFLDSTKPYLLLGGRVVRVKEGWADYAVDLVEYHFQKGDLVVFYAETLIEKRELSEDFELDAFTFTNTQPTSKNYVILHLNDQTTPVIDSHFNLIWNLLEQSDCQRECIKMQIQSLLKYVDYLDSKQEKPKPASRSKSILERFVALVTRNAAKERYIGFYADKLCIAPHYLSTLIKQTSGYTPMEWINDVTVKEIKVWLLYSNDTVTEIADKLNFPTSSALTKFFKRETGMTPSEYRASSK